MIPDNAPFLNNTDCINAMEFYGLGQQMALQCIIQLRIRIVIVAHEDLAQKMLVHTFSRLNTSKGLIILHFVPGSKRDSNLEQQV